MYIPHQMIGTTSISKNKELLQLPMVKSEEERRETRAESNWNKSSLTANGIGLSGRVSTVKAIQSDGMGRWGAARSANRRELAKALCGGG